MNDLKRQMQIFVNDVWKDAHHTTANEFPEDCVRFAEPIRPEMPEPKKTYADHSSRAYSREQMVQAMLDAVELYRRTQPEATAPAQDLSAAIERKLGDTVKPILTPEDFGILDPELAKRANNFANAMMHQAALASPANALGAAIDKDAKIAAQRARIMELEEQLARALGTPVNDWCPECHARESSGDALSAGDRVDAERYRYLRNPDPQPARKLDVCDHHNIIIEGEKLDEWIDTAILQSQKGESHGTS